MSMYVLKFLHIILVCVLFSSDSYSKELISEHSQFYMEVIKEGVKPEDQTKIENIYFDSGESGLSKENKRKLNQLVKILKDDTILEVLVVTHTDSKGAKYYNKELSRKRGEKIKAYLINKDIAYNRIYIKFFGEEKLVNHCEVGVVCDEFMHSKNRRAEFVLFKD